MYDNYPPGAANDPNAPYNQSPNPTPTNVDVEVTYTLNKSFVIPVSHYMLEDNEEFERDDDGSFYVVRSKVPNFEDTNFVEEFQNSGTALGIPQLLNELQTLVKDKLKDVRKLPENTVEEKTLKDRLLRKYLTILESSLDWTVYDFEVIKD